MLTFLEFYETLVGFVNYKLYTDENLAYPPVLDLLKDAGAAGLAAFSIQPKGATRTAPTSTTESTPEPGTGRGARTNPFTSSNSELAASFGSAAAPEPAAAAPAAPAASTRAQAKERLKTLPSKLAALAKASAATAGSDDMDADAPTAGAEDDDALDEFPPNQAASADETEAAASASRVDIGRVRWSEGARSGPSRA